MNTIKLTLAFLIISLSMFCQNIFIKTEAYESLFSIEYGQPIYVKYTLSKTSNNCDIKHLKFKKEEVSINDSDYNDIGYVIAQMANVEDFKSDCKLAELTYRYYNCIAQTSKLHKGKWKSFEEEIREMAQTDSLLIICGGIYSKNRISNHLAKADWCYKIVYSLKQKRFLFIKIFTNLSTDIWTKDLTIEQLEKIVGIKFGL